MRLAGLRAAVTAAGAGIGKASAIAFQEEGAEVFASDIRGQALTELANAGIATHELDVTDMDAVFIYAERVGPIDVLLNCAGHVHDGTILDSTIEDYQKSFDVNVLGMWNTIKAFLPAMLKRSGGSIINIASVASSISGVPRRCIYGASKGAVIGLTKGVAADFVRYGVRCNAICPGTVDTPSLHGRIGVQSDPAAALQQFVARQPMGRLGDPAEIAALAVYLASRELAFTTGGVHIIDGGWKM